MASLACVLFDLDGTLLDTAPDMANALNRLLCEQGDEPLPLSAIRPVVSHGSRGLLKLGFDLTPEMDRYRYLQERFLSFYRSALAVHTCLFPTMDEVLTTLEARGIVWGIVTNKPGWLTEPLLVELALRQRCACVVSGDTLAKRKPDPEPLWFACEQLQLDPRTDRCLYVGDAERDIQAGRRAGMLTAAAAYGYRYDDENPQDWQADILLNSPRELLDCLHGIGDFAPR